MLNSISLSQVRPPECVTQELQFGSICTFTCPMGYLFEAALAQSVTRICQRNGNWTGEYKPCVGEFIKKMEHTNFFELLGLLIKSCTEEEAEYTACLGLPI